MNLSGLLTTTLFFGGASSALIAQRPTVLPIGRATAVQRGGFSGIAKLRELPDGRVIVADTADRRLYLADFTASAPVAIGRQGEGPGEYRSPVGLLALGGDSTLVIDGELQRWIVFRGISPVATIGPESPAMAGLRNGRLLGADVGGRIVARVRPRVVGRPIDQGDSLILVRVSLASGKMDTLARLRSGLGGPPGSARSVSAAETPASEASGGRQYMMAPLVGDQAIGFADGWVAVARVDPYRIDWIDPSNTLRRGAPLPGARIPFTDQEKRFYLQRLSEQDGTPAGSPGSIKDWMPTLPPIWGFSSLSAAPSGELIVERTPSSAAPEPTYDVVARDGTLRGQIVLRRNERVVGVGARSIYISETDVDGLESLRRHAWPK